MQPSRNGMANIAQAIRTFQSGSMSQNEFFAQVDKALATDKGSSERLLEILSEDHTKVMLPPDIYAELQQRVEHLTEPRSGNAGDETRLVEHAAAGRSAAPDNRGERLSHDNAGNRQIGEPGDFERIKGVGDTLNKRFVLEECIGFGGMGTVYKALDLRKLEASDRNPYIAIKVLNVQFRGHPKSLIALQREAKKAQALAHPNIVTVYDFDRDGSTVFLTMEYLLGKPLGQILRNKDFTGMQFREAMRVISRVARALSYAHERGFVHCDLKPANIFLTDSGEVKVIDFGIARAFRKPTEDTEATVFDAGSLGGLTPAYASPEMLAHEEPDPRDDIYALACITYELLTGRHPFNRLAAGQAQHAGMKAARPKNLNSQQWRALRTALAFGRDKRTPTVERFLQEMGKAGQPVRNAVFALLALLLIGLSVLGWLFYRDGGREADVIEAAAPPSAPPASSPASDAVVPEKPAPAVPAMPAPELTLASVRPVLAGVPCSALVARVDGGSLAVQGYLPAEYGSARLTALLKAIPGLKSLSVKNLHEVTQEKCAVIETLGPYWIRNAEAQAAASMRMKNGKTQLVEGDTLIVDIRSPKFSSFVYVDYFALDGGVAHLLPNIRARDNEAPPSYEATIGSLGGWVISKPFGAELIVMLATPEPIFPGLRPDHEARSDYLAALGSRLKAISDKFGPDRVAVDFVQITTSARKR